MAPAKLNTASPAMKVKAALGWTGWTVMLAVVVTSFLFERTTLADEVWCVLKRLTGMSCPGCGLTRSFCAMARGELAAAFGYHLAGPWLWATAVAAVVWHPLRTGMAWRSMWTRAPRLLNVWFALFAVLFLAQILRWASLFIKETTLF